MKPRLLIVEDETIIARSLELTLSRFGYEVLGHAASAAEAVEKAGETHPDLVLMDIVLQDGKDGIEAAAEIRDRFRIPVIYLTAYADEETIDRARHTEPLGYIVKPFEAHDVRAAIEVGLHKHLLEQKIKEDLEEQVRERTRRLQMVIQDLESFSYSISHDLKAPLRAITNFAAILFEEQAHCFDDNGERHLRIIMQNGKLMGQLLDDLLTFSRLSLTETTIAPVDMAHLVRSVADDLRNTEPPDRRLEITIHDLPPVHGSELLLRQVLANLIGNAMKFTRTRERAAIEVGAVRGSEEVTYYVRDNGVGFDMEYAENIFDIFRRAHPEGEFEGSGVGLAIVKRIIARHGGRVWAEAKEGDGATFFFALPDGMKESNEKSGEQDVHASPQLQ